MHWKFMQGIELRREVDCGIGGARLGSMATRRKPQRERAKKTEKQHSACLLLRIIPSLGEVPIEDSFAEKRFIESGTLDQYCLYLYGQALTVDHLGEVSDEALQARQIEVYRLCYEAPNAKREKVLAAFVRHLPGLICQADWFVKLVRECAQIRPSENDDLRNRTFSAIANGFRGAASPMPENDRFLRADLIWVPRMHLRRLSEKLAAWYKDEDLVVATPEGRLESAREKATKLVKEDPRLPTNLSQIVELLAKEHLYEAALLIISVQFGIPQHDLDRQSSS
ncbi:MAG TPA: hypothetical protein VN310_15495 [Candidatus Dormibacteraeota bacterium]|nr:hypothetical protein [Candidatus Dormibacteraeota bacterium]